MAEEVQFSWASMAQLAVGAFVGSLLSPRLWFAWSPLRWIADVLSLAYAESYGDADAVNPTGGEVGILQFSSVGSQVAGWAAGTAESDWRRSPFWCGIAAAFYVSNLLAGDARWYSMVLPGDVEREGSLRASWRRHVYPGAPDEASDEGQRVAALYRRAQFWARVVSAVSLAPVVLFFVCAFVGSLSLRRRR